MKYSLTIVFITARKEPRVEWFFQSLANQLAGGWGGVHLIVVDLFHAEHPEISSRSTLHIPPKPNVWQGVHRLTKEDWWAISNARNTGICLCRTEWIAFVDDRSVLCPGWLNRVSEAMTGNYAVNGSYEKVHKLVVESGDVKSYTEPGNGKDPRVTRSIRRPVKTYGGSWFGCNMALPLEWCLAVNGFDEWCDSVGLEDVVFGAMLAKNGYGTMFDPRMKLMEDRTPSEVGEMPKRTDKGVSPKDRSHALLDRIGGSKRATHTFDIRAMRDSVLAGNPFPPPWGPTHDFFDNEPLGEMYVR